MSEQRKVWLAFFLLALFWGTSFMFIKIALNTMGPVLLVAIRLLIGSLGLIGISRWRGIPLPAGRTEWSHLAFVGFLGIAFPFILVTWSESGTHGLDSGVAAVLNSMVPLFSLIFSGLILRVEPVTGRGVAGLLIGFGGVVLLFSRSLTGDALASLLPPLAISVAAACYAVTSAYAKRHLHGHPIAVAAGQIIVADVTVWLGIIFTGIGPAPTFPPLTLLSLLSLGLLGSCLAYILYFYILQHWTTTQTTLVTYVIPIVAVASGVVFLGEALDWRLLVGGFLILTGIGVVTWQRRPVKA